MLPGMELLSCPELAVPREVMQHVVKVESSHNPYAIGVVGGHLVRQPKRLDEALATVRMLESRGFNFSVGIAQVNRYNLGKYGLASYAQAFEMCPNLQAGARILAECYGRYQDWGKSFSCYYSGNAVTGFRHGYVQKVFASMAQAQGRVTANPPGTIAVVGNTTRRSVPVEYFPLQPNARAAAPASRAEAVDPTVAPTALSDPAFAGGGPMRAPVTSPTPAIPAVPADLGASNSISAGPVRLQPTSPANAVPIPPAQPDAGDGAFVF